MTALGKESLDAKGGHVHIGLLAWTAGTLIAIACVLFVIFAGYAVWWIFFRLGKQ
jgi:hypothetical protein